MVRAPDVFHCSSFGVFLSYASRIRGMLAQKIALETNEKAALKVAHRSYPLILAP
jgi:hypothetical protein